MFRQRAVGKGPKEIIDDCGMVWIYDPASHSIYLLMDLDPDKPTRQTEINSHAEAIERLIELDHLTAPAGYETAL